MGFNAPYGIADPANTLAEFKRIAGGWNPSGPLDKGRMGKVELSTTGITTGTGIYGYPLEKPAKQLYSYWTWLVQNLSREQSPNGGLAQHWVSVDGVMGAGWDMGVAEGAVGTMGQNQVSNNLAQYKTLGSPGEVTFEAISAAQSFDDAKAMEVVHTLQRLRMGEEASILGGDTTGIAKPAALVFADTALAADGALTAATTYYYAVSAFTLLGSATLAGNTQSTGHASADAANETDGRTGNHATTASSVGSTATIITWAAVPGAVGYNVYVGTTSTVHFWKTVYTNKVEVINSTQASSNVPNTGNQTANTNQYDGIIHQASFWSNPAGLTNPDGSAYSNFIDMAGAAFTGNGYGGVTEIDTALEKLFYALKVGPELLIVSPQEAINIRNKILAGTSTAGSYRYMTTVGPDGKINGGTIFASYFNPFMPDQPLKVLAHPFCPPGTSLALTMTLPAQYPNANIGTTWSIDARRDYYEVDYAVATSSGRVYPFGTYVEAVLKGYFPGGTLVFSGIANG